MNKYGNLRDSDDIPFQEPYHSIKSEEEYDATIRKIEKRAERYRVKAQELEMLVYMLEAEKKGLRCQYMIENATPGYITEYIYSPTLVDAELFRDEYCKEYASRKDWHVEQTDEQWRVFCYGTLRKVFTIMQNPKYIGENE